jgi:lipoprotein-anchoring transpeptidase ErfK/SrfK
VSLRGKRSPDFYIESGSPKNPMGAAALVLADSELAIHGTNNPASIGGFVSAGCMTSWICTAAYMSVRGWYL